MGQSNRFTFARARIMLSVGPVDSFAPGQAWHVIHYPPAEVVAKPVEMLPRLLRSLYRAYDKDPYAGIACRIRHRQGFVWTIAGRVLHASTVYGPQLGHYELETLTVAQLCHRLQDAGCSIAFLDPDYQGLSAACLIAGSNSQYNSNGDALYAYSSLLWAILDSMAFALDLANAQIPDAVLEIDYAFSDGDFMDIWGEYWGIPRIIGEADTDYRNRTIDTILMPKVNAMAMARAVSLLAGLPVEIYEPWRDTFYLDSSRMDQDHLCDGIFYNACLFQATGAENVPWATVTALLERIKPAGVIMLEPKNDNYTRCAERDEAIYPGVYGMPDSYRLDGLMQGAFTTTTTS